MKREEAVQADKDSDPDVTVASVKTNDMPPGLPMMQAAYLPGLAFDEMYAAGGEVRDHYGSVHARLTTLSPEALADRQKTLERSFLLPGITFAGHGAETPTEPNNPPDLVPTIMHTGEWHQAPKGHSQHVPPN